MLIPTNQTDSHQRDHVCSTSLCVSEDSTSEYEHRVSEPPTDTDLQEVLEGADNILYEVKEKTFQEFNFRSMEKKTSEGCFRLHLQG